jgi:hypothetical protein
MNCHYWSVSFCALSLLVNHEAEGHARWKAGSLVSPPRDVASGLKSPPCGGSAKTSTPRSFQAGEAITVEFEETINHPGYFEIRILGEGDAPVIGYTEPLAKIDDIQNNTISGGRNHQYTAKITLPNIKCDGCSLQLIQYMTEDPNFPSKYYSCSDVSLVDNGTALPASVQRPPKPMNLKIQRSP